MKRGLWQRSGNLLRVKLLDIEPEIPEDVELERIVDFVVVVHNRGKWEELLSHIDYCDGYGRWIGNKISENTCLCFHAPKAGTKPECDWERSAEFDGWIDLNLWDSRSRYLFEGIRIYYSVYHQKNPNIEISETPLRLEEVAAGYTVMYGNDLLIRFNSQKGYQIDWAKSKVGNKNLIPHGFVWRWLLTESTSELRDWSNDHVEFTPVVREGMMLVIIISGNSPAGMAETTLRIFFQNSAIVLEFSDYRARRRRQELPSQEHPRSYAGQIASPFPKTHYAAFMLLMDGEGTEICDHLFPHETVKPGDRIGWIYEGPRKQRGWNWLALKAEGSSAAISVHSRTHYPDHPFKAGKEDGRIIIALEPFGSELDDSHYHSCDLYSIILCESVEEIRETFDTLDTFPLLVQVYVKRDSRFLETYECLRRWINLNLHYLMINGKYRNALKTNGSFRDDQDTCMTAIMEMIRLYEKTGWKTFLDVSARAAEHAAEWILSGKFNKRGNKVGANSGGIYQNEQIYLLLSLARTYSYTRNPILLEAINFGVEWMKDRRGGQGMWGWEKYMWHVGGLSSDGKPLHYWPVNTCQFATLNFRLYQILGEKIYYDEAMEILDDFLKRLRKDSWEIFPGGGVSDTTRSIHLFSEAIEIAWNDPRISPSFLMECIERTLERFWIGGWILVRNMIYGEVITAGNIDTNIFSPGFEHWHNCGSYLDILPRIEIAAEVGVSKYLTQWSAKDLIYDFDMRYGMEEHTHLTRYSMRDTDLEPGCWLDCELLPTLKNLWKQDWIENPDFKLMLYKIHRMVQRSFIPLDADHGGWANAYESNEGRPIKYLAYWEQRHSYEAFSPGEPLEMWGVPTREAFHDHSTHYWSALEQLCDFLLRAETISLKGRIQMVRCFDEGLYQGIPCPRPILVERKSGSEVVSIISSNPGVSWKVLELRKIRIDSSDFWLIAVDRIETKQDKEL